jgi:hypothetical protein
VCRLRGSNATRRAAKSVFVRRKGTAVPGSYTNNICPARQFASSGVHSASAGTRENYGNAGRREIRDSCVVRTELIQDVRRNGT